VTDVGYGELLIRSIRAGVCGTDREIHQGLYGKAPQGSDYLILGHESLGVVEKAGRGVAGYDLGDVVVRAVRRPCGCKNCSAGSNDLCPTGDFTESGIKELHGCMAEYFKDSPAYLFKIPRELADVAVLLEPQSVVEKVWRQANLIQRRLIWEPKKAIVIGAGPIGLLQSMLFVAEGLETYVVARSKYGNVKSRIAESVGARYLSASEYSIEGIRKAAGLADIVVDASGDSSMAFESFGLCANNGVVCLTSITGGDKAYQIPSDRFNLDIVLGNKVAFGSVNANRVDYEIGIIRLASFMERWQNSLYSMFTRRLQVADCVKAMDSDSSDIKTTIEF